MEEKKSKAKKKAYSDYPQLQFTTDPETRDKLMARIERIRDRYNKNKDDNSLSFSRSDVALEALNRGLQMMEEELKKK